MSKIKFRSRASRENNSGDDNPSREDNVGKSGMTTEELLAQLVSKLGDTKSDRTDPPPTNRESDPRTLLGLSDLETKALTDGLGEESSNILLSLMSQVVNSSADNDALLLQEMRKQTEELKKAQSESSRSLKDMFAQQADVAVSQFDSVFTEDNKDDVEEMLDILTAKSGGMFDAVNDLNDAMEKKDVSRLAKYQQKLEDFSAYKYKDHQSISGGSQAPARATKESRVSDSEIDKLQAQIDRELSSTTGKDLNKIMDLQSQLKDKVEASL